MEAWRCCWIKLLDEHKSKLDLSNLDLNGSHTSVLRGGQEAEYQGGKKRKTTNALYLSDRRPISMFRLVAGNHNVWIQVVGCTIIFYLLPLRFKFIKF